MCRGVSGGSAGDPKGASGLAGSDGPDEPDEALAGLQGIAHTGVKRLLNMFDIHSAAEATGFESQTCGLARVDV